MVEIVEIDGEIVDSPRRFVPPEKRRVGYVAQEGNLFPHLTVAKNVGFGLSRTERAGGRLKRSSRWWASGGWPSATRTSSPGGSSRGSRSLEPSRPDLGSCC